MTDQIPNLTLLQEQTPEGVKGALRAALQIAEELPMVGCCVLLFNGEGQCWQLREVRSRRRLETLGALQMIQKQLLEELDE